MEEKIKVETNTPYSNKQRNSSFTEGDVDISDFILAIKQNKLLFISCILLSISIFTFKVIKESVNWTTSAIISVTNLNNLETLAKAYKNISNNDFQNLNHQMTLRVVRNINSSPLEEIKRINLKTPNTPIELKMTSNSVQKNIQTLEQFLSQIHTQIKEEEELYFSMLKKFELEKINNEINISKIVKLPPTEQFKLQSQLKLLQETTTNFDNEKFFEYFLQTQRTSVSIIFSIFGATVLGIFIGYLILLMRIILKN